MKPLLRILSGLLLFGLLAAPAVAYADRPSVAGEELVEKVHEAELKISVSRATGARVEALKAFQKYLDDSIQKLPDKNPDDETRRLRASLWSFQSYLAKIDTKAFDPRNCPQYRAEILLAFSPHDAAPAYVPGEARESLKILSLACGKPELAEIPGFAPEPPPKLKNSH